MGVEMKPQVEKVVSEPNQVTVVIERMPHAARPIEGRASAGYAVLAGGRTLFATTIACPERELLARLFESAFAHQDQPGEPSRGVAADVVEPVQGRGDADKRGPAARTDVA